MYVGRDYDPAEQEEVRGYGLDFVNDIDPDETLMSATWTITVTAGTDPNPSSHLAGPPILVTPLGSTLQTATVQAIGGILPDVTYKVHASVTTNRGNTVSLWTHIRGVHSL